MFVRAGIVLPHTSFCFLTVRAWALAGFIRVGANRVSGARPATVRIYTFFLLVHVHTRLCVHACISCVVVHARAPVRTHGRLHARAYAHAYMYVHVYVACVFLRARVRRSIRSRAHTRSYVCMRVMCMRSRVRGYVCACACACERVQTRAFVRTCAMLHCPAGALSHANRFRGAALRLV